MITKEQQKDLRLMVPNEMAAERVFYLKNEDGTFSTCKLSEFEFQYFKPITEKLFKAKLLYRRINKPFESFA